MTGPYAARPASGRTAWARNLAAPVRDFLSTLTGGAIVLVGAIVAALAWANSPWPASYESAWTTELAIRLGDHGVAMDLRHWINQGLMTLFFLVVGLEAKRELDVGQLRERRRLTLPAVAAVGGVIVPVAIYFAVTTGGPDAEGWGMVVSTDTALALGVLALVAPGGTRLRVTLLAFAVVDDLVALLVIAVAYTEELEPVPLAIAVGLFGVVLALRYAPRQWRGPVAAIVGVGVWLALLESGIDPVITGLAVGLATAAYPPPRAKLERVTDLARSFREQPTPQLARSAQRGLAAAISPNERLQYRLHPWTSFVIVPLFALANAGITIDGDLLADAARSPITLGIIAGYVVGKPLGVVSSVWLGTRTALWGARRALSWPAVLGGGTVAGIGFTVALLIAGIAFEGRRLEEAKLGVLAAALLASLLAWAVFRIIARLPAGTRARQIAPTSEPLLDLVDEVDPDRDHVRGGSEAPVTLVEYGDYECPYCGQAEVAVRDLLEAQGDQLRYVWRHLPLSDVHPNAQAAAEAAEAAAAQGAFWSMHDRLIANQDRLALPDLLGNANDVGLDLERFEDELRRREHAPRIGRDVETADASGVAGTPTFFINGVRYAGTYEADALNRAVERARQRARLGSLAQERTAS